MFSKDIGIDLGTANVLIYVKGQGIVLNEPSIVALDTETQRVVGVGKEAWDVLGRTPARVKAIRPLKDGVIADFEITEIMLNEFIKRTKAKSFLLRPRILICCPSETTEVERNAIIEAAERTGARKVYLEIEPKVAAIGAGMDINKASASMIVDIGGGTTDIAVLSLGDIVTSSSIKLAGETLNQDLIKYIREKYRLLIGEKTAEEIKTDFACVYKPNKKRTMKVAGRNLLTGLPDSIEFSQEESLEAMSESLEKIVKEVIIVLEDTSPELAGDIAEAGLVLTGGGSLLDGMVEYFKEKVGVPVLRAEEPLTSVAEGTGILLEDIRKLEENSKIS